MFLLTIHLQSNSGRTSLHPSVFPHLNMSNLNRHLYFQSSMTGLSVHLRAPRRGQVTLFIIAGIVIIFVFGLLFFFSRLLPSQQLEQQRIQVLHNFIEVPALRHYVSVCVENALKTGLELIGRQGGYIFAGQPGGLFTPSFVSYSPFNISFAIIPSQQNLPPLYPCSESFVDRAPAYCRYPFTRDTIFFGEERLPPIEGGVFSLQQQLERYIAFSVARCADITHLLTEDEFRGYDVRTGEPHAAVQFGSSTVAVHVEYPLTITLGGHEPATQFAVFDAQLPVRFKKIYGAIQDLVHKDISFIDFNLSAATFNETFHSEFVPFSVLSPPIRVTSFHLGEDTIFIFNDSSSLPDDHHYIFQFVRKNRPPVLYYIGQNPSVHDVYDYLALVGENITFTVDAVDPDEDPITLSSSGDFGDSRLFPFTSSSVPQTAGYFTQLFNASDSSSTDRQAVRVLLDRPLLSNFTVINHYIDIPQNTISSEDPFFLNASSSNTTLDPFADYTFSWHAMTFGRTDYACTLFPGYGRCDDPSPSIDTIRQSNNWSSFGHFGIELQVNLTYNGREQSASSTVPVILVPCLPHRNISDPSPYPYNQGSDPYLANHACCIGDPAGDSRNWRVASKNELACYTNPSTEQSCQGGRIIFQRSTTIFCDGIRGNTCRQLPDQTNVQHGSFVSSGVCGPNGRYGCSDIAPSCEGAAPYSLIQTQGWCYGTEGCALFCPHGTPIVDVNHNGIADTGDACGCSTLVGNPCDEDANNTFNGVCASTLGVSYCTDQFG